MFLVFHSRAYIFVIRSYYEQNKKLEISPKALKENAKVKRKLNFTFN